MLERRLSCGVYEKIAKSFLDVDRFQEHHWDESKACAHGYSFGLVVDYKLRVSKFRSLALAVCAPASAILFIWTARSGSVKSLRKDIVKWYRSRQNANVPDNPPASRLYRLLSDAHAVKREGMEQGLSAEHGQFHSGKEKSGQIRNIGSHITTDGHRMVIRAKQIGKRQAAFACIESFV